MVEPVSIGTLVVVSGIFLKNLYDIIIHIRKSKCTVGTCVSAEVEMQDATPKTERRAK